MSDANAPTLDDYTLDDGYTAEQEPQCPHCEEYLRSDDRDYESVINQEGTSCKNIDETDPRGCLR